MRSSLALIGVVAITACGSSRHGAAPPAPPPLRPAAVIPMSDPAEYAIDRISRDAGQAIFERTGIGDPYRTGMPYPVFLALQRAYPDLLGASPEALAPKFGFVARAADPSSADLDRREGLPIGLHLTTDPMTGVPFLMTACAACHAEHLRWNGGDAVVIGLGNKRIRIHAYDRAFAAVTHAPGFSAAKLGVLATEAAASHHLTWPAQYRDAITDATVGALVTRAKQRASLHERTAADPPGRVATIESFALVLAQLTGVSVDAARDIGWAKVPDVIGYAQRTTLS